MRNRRLQYIFLILQIILIICLAVPYVLDLYIPIYIVKSNSMAPNISEGSLIVVSRKELLETEDLVGKIIVYRNPLDQRIVVHRVMGKEGEYFVTKGDGNPFVDFFRPTHRYILGVVIFTLF